jgi:MinD superfamily P-loop ATPase
MKELVVISGKGGSGKTCLTAAFASLAQNRVLCDADVDAADLYLLMNPEIKQRTDFMGGGLAEIVPEKCTQCGLCQELCRFDAVSDDFRIDPIGCEGCGVCVDLCPEQAIDFPIQTCGEWFISDTRFGPMVHARLGIAEENSGKLVTVVRKEAAQLAAKTNADLILTDGPPGIGCPVIASVGGAFAVLIVTEPTVSGLHDMERVAQLAAHFKISTWVCINKYDLNMEQTQAIEKLAKKHEMIVMGRVPFDPSFTKAMIQRQTVSEYDNKSAASQAVAKVWDNILKTMAA